MSFFCQSRPTKNPWDPDPQHRLVSFGKMLLHSLGLHLNSGGAVERAFLENFKIEAPSIEVFRNMGVSIKELGPAFDAPTSETRFIPSAISYAVSVVSKMLPTSIASVIARDLNRRFENQETANKVCAFSSKGRVCIWSGPYTGKDRRPICQFLECDVAAIL
jgi:hypothetical protein